MHLTYSDYLDRVLGGWLGKCMGGAVGARFEGHKYWIEIAADKMFPEKMPPNDDLDLQVLWLKVLEERGPALTSDHLAQAWLEGCWYPFNEYGIFRRNFSLGIHAPTSGRFTNQFWETGEGCPIRAEIWGYVFPGDPDRAAAFAEKDGTLDHTEQSVGAEKMFAAMASMAFFVPDVRKLARMYLHYLPAGSRIDRLTREAFACYDAGLSLRDARDRLILQAGIPEACDAQLNIPFTFLGLLYGNNDLTQTMLAALACGYDTDCTLATAAALLGQILGAKRIPQNLKAAVGDELVMGIEYKRPEMTISALARDTARVGVLLSRAMNTGVTISETPTLAPFPATATPPKTSLRVDYHGLPAAGPGEPVAITVHIDDQLADNSTLALTGPAGWIIAPASVALIPGQRSATFTLHAPALGRGATFPHKNLFTATLTPPSGTPAATYTFGVAGAGVYYFLGAFFDPKPEPNDPAGHRAMQHHFAYLAHNYLPEPDVDIRAQYEKISRTLGRPAILHSYEHEIDLTRLTALQGAYVAYVARVIDNPVERPVHVIIGNTDSFRLYLNGKQIAETDNIVCWSPFNNTCKVTLPAGRNVFLLKLLKRTDAMRFTFGLRDARQKDWMNGTDWLTDLAEGSL